MLVISRDTLYSDIDRKYQDLGIPVSEKMLELVKDLFEDNPDIELSYKGIRMSMNECITFEEDGTSGFVIHSALSESDIDNLKIYGIKPESMEDCSFVLEELTDVESVQDYYLRKTNIF